MMRTVGGLGHDAAVLNVTRAQAVRDIADGPEADLLLASVLPHIRELAKAEIRSPEASPLNDPDLRRGHPLVFRIEELSPENPFLDPNWRDQVES